MRKFSLRLTQLFAISLAAVSCVPKTGLVDPCDVLVPINPKPETNRYMVENDKPTAQGVARNRERFSLYKCGTEGTDSRK